MTDLSASEARRTFLAAQSLARRRPTRTPHEREFRAYVARQGVLQVDSVNVLARAHYLPIFSRFGSYSTGALDAWLWGSGETFEHWGHEASVMPLELLAPMSHRMGSPGMWERRVRERLNAERPGLLERVRAEVEAHGPVTATELEHLAPRERKGGTWWDYSHVKSALELLFAVGHIAASRRGNFERVYDSTQRQWGRPPVDQGGWALADQDARKALFLAGLQATGVGTVADVADHFRLQPTASRALAHEIVDDGDATWVSVEGWKQPALLAVAAADPGRATGAALLSPFDPVCWFRPRLARMFSVDYRIEIYTPAEQRVYGYYCLPFLLGDDIVARVDLKADRKQRALLVQATWREPHVAPGSRRRSDATIARALAEELRLMATWLGLDVMRVGARGDLASALAAAADGA